MYREWTEAQIRALSIDATKTVKGWRENTMKKALLFQGGWDGHEPKLTSARFSRILQEEGFAVSLDDV